MRTKTARAFDAIFGGLAALFLASGTALAGSWNMPTPYPSGSFHTQNVEQFAADVRSETDGAVNIVVHPAGSLVKHAEIKNAVRSGQVQIGEFLLSRLSNENPVFEADAVPFLADSYDASRALWAAQRPVVEEQLARQNLTVLYAVPWPPQGLYSRTQLDTLSALAGMRFRTYNAATERFAQLAGAMPTQVEVPDIPQAFATGRVAGMITSSTTGVNSKAWDYLSHYTDTRAFLPKNIIVVNTNALDVLDASDRAAILQAAKRAEERGWAMSMAETDKQTHALGDNGLVVSEPSASLRADLSRIGEQMTREWVARAGTAGTDLLTRFEEERSKTVDAVQSN